MPDFHLFHSPGTCGRVTLVALEMIGAPYRVTIVRHFGDGPGDPSFGFGDSSYRALNPTGVLPTLLIDGKPLTENIAILFTLARLFPAAELLPIRDPISEGEALSRLSFCVSHLHPILTRINRPQFFCDASQEATERTREMAITMMDARLGVVEPVLARQPWWMGERFSIADVYLQWVTEMMRTRGLDFSAFPAIVAHIENVKQQPAMRRALDLEAKYRADLEAAGIVYYPIYPSPKY